MAIQLDREEQLTRFYRAHADRLRQDIARRTRGLDDAIIDDACAFAWELLCRRPDIDLERYQAYWWVYKVALRQAWALGRARRREQPIGGLNGVDEDSLEPLDLDSDVADVVAERVEHASMRECSAGFTGASAASWRSSPTDSAMRRSPPSPAPATRR